MNQELDAVLTQQADRETYANLLKKVCGEVALHGYATANSYEPAECVSRWTENVIRTLRNRNVFEEYRPDSGGKTAGTAHESIEGAEAE